MECLLSLYPLLQPQKNQVQKKITSDCSEKLITFSVQLLSLDPGNTDNATKLYELKKNDGDLVPKQVSARI